MDGSLFELLGALAGVAGVAALLMAPTLVAYLRGNPLWPVIALSNVVLGPTGVGWLMVLVWALLPWTPEARTRSIEIEIEIVQRG